MDRRFALVAFAAGVLWLGAAHARYVSPTPPSGFAPGSGGGFVYTPPTPLEQLDSIRKESAGKPTGWYRTPGPTLPGGGGKPPAAMRFGSGAARALAGAVTAARYLNAAGMVVGLAWLAAHCIGRTDAGNFYNKCGGSGEPQPVSDGYEYTWPGTGVRHQMPADACTAGIAYANSTAAAGRAYVYTGLQQVSGQYRCGYTLKIQNPDGTTSQLSGSQALTRYATPACPAGWTVTSSGSCLQFPEIVPMTPEEVADHMELKPLPNVLPAFVPYPLWSPADGSLTPSVFGHPTVVNPNRTYEDATTPSPETWRQPQGSPKLNPETGKVEQPVTDWKHKPTDSDPFQMETEPGKVETTDPEGQTEPGTAEEGEPSTPKPESETQDLCEKNPDILACAHINPGSLDPVPVQNRDQPLTIDPAGGFGPSSSACPADRTSQVSFGVVAFPYTPLCQFAEGVRPIVLGLAWLLAGFSFFGLSRKT